MLVNCNALSQIHLQKATSEFKKHIQLLHELKRDLDNIFKRVKVLKVKTATQYPQQYQGTSHSFLTFTNKFELTHFSLDAINYVQPVLEEEEETSTSAAEKPR